MVIKKLSRFLANMRIRYKLSILVVLSLLLIIFINITMYYNLNRITRQMDAIYQGNVTLSELEDSLDTVQNSIAEYLNTKSTDSLNNYYLAEQEFDSMLQALETETTDNQQKLMERNIFYMSQHYLELTSDTIDAKRGRNVEKYKETYEQSSEIYRYIKSYITSLNGYRFRSNTQSYIALSSAVGYLEIMSIVIFVLMTIFDVMLVILVTRNITQPLHELSLAANSVSEGQLETTPQVKVHGMDEVGVVTVAFNQMMTSIPEFIARLKEGMEKEQQLKEKEILMEAHLKDAQLKYLQAQINPHFLFNTLNAGSQLAMMEHADRTYDYIQNVAAFFRYNVSKNDEVTLAQEIELVDIYIYILNVRFSGDIHFKKEIESEDLLRVMLPGMILQPIVENSVNYGIRDIEREGHITLSVYRVDDNVCISISDNGIGMSQELIKLVLSGEYSSLPDNIKSEEKYEAQNGQKKKGNGVGLNNVFERLRLYFDGRNNVDIISNGKNQGTEVLITIPFDDDTV
ncbi:Histidine kinase-, DNA gyrase B-, and HSP90-like ATPase [Lachnospiraceae bacterium NE2001]|nr:Histidine kinase-, DNA gyrase B-, and HSP90-like ATPase [Lachnospiraceae bacterium NE2001]